MEDSKINIEKVYNHWILRSDQDFETMLNLHDSKDYHWALFIGHMVIERLLKSSDSESYNGSRSIFTRSEKTCKTFFD